MNTLPEIFLKETAKLIEAGTLDELAEDIITGLLGYCTLQQSTLAILSKGINAIEDNTKELEAEIEEYKILLKEQKNRVDALTQMNKNQAATIQGLYKK